MSGSHVRLLVMTDWSVGSTDVAVLVAFSRIASGEIPVELTFVVNHEASQSDVEKVCAIIEKLPRGVESLNGAEVSIESISEAKAKNYHSVITSGEPSSQSVVDVAQFVATMAQCCAALSFKVANNADTQPMINHLNGYSGIDLEHGRVIPEIASERIPEQKLGGQGQVFVVQNSY